MLHDLAVSEEQRQTSGGRAVIPAASTLLQTGVGGFQPGLQLQQRLLLAQRVDPSLWKEKKLLFFF